MAKQLHELFQEPRVPKILIYGKVGAGKTGLLLTLGEGSLILDMDDGLQTGMSIQDSFQKSRQSVEVEQFLEPEPHKKAVAFAKAKEYIYGLPALLGKAPYKYRAIGLDSLSAYADSALNYIMFNSGKLGKQPEIQHWGLAFMEIKQVLAVLRSLPVPVVVLAHEQVKSVGTGEDKEDTLEIAVKGKNLPTEICRLFDEIWYIRAKPAGGGKFSYIIQTASDSVLEARSRFCLTNYTDSKIGMWELIKQLQTRKEVKA